MQLDLESSDQSLQLQSYQDGMLQINDKIYQSSLILTANKLIDNWRPQQLSELQHNDWQAILKLQPELVLVGTGAQHQHIPDSMLAPLYSANIAVEVMSTAAACRTYRLLTADARPVVAALLIN